MQFELKAQTSADMEALGRRLAARLAPGQVMFFRGELGAGKTTLIRGVLRGLGVTAAVKSPTYTLVEPYRLNGLEVFHFDLHRLKDPEELEFMGLRDYLGGKGVCLIEWPERGAGYLPPPDAEAQITLAPSTQALERRVQFTAHTDKGMELLRDLAYSRPGS